MKKLIALLLALVMVMALAACGGETQETTPAGEETTTTPVETTEATEETTQDTKETPNPVEVMTHEEFMAAEDDTAVTVEFAVQGAQTYNAEYGNTSVYGADENGGYFAYRMACTAEEAAKLTEGTWIRISGTKTSWSGQVEIIDITSIEFIEKEAYVAQGVDVTELLGTEELIGYMTLPVQFKGVTVKSVDYKDGEEGNDIYLTVTLNETDYDFCVETDLTNSETEVYKAVAALEAGAVIDVQGFLYWYEGPNPHITGVTVAE